MKTVFAVLSLILAPTAAFSAEKYEVCGQIQREGTTLFFAQEIDGSAEVSLIYSNDPKVQAELVLLDGFREVCVEAVTDERNNVAVSRILSRDE